MRVSKKLTKNPQVVLKVFDNLETALFGFEGTGTTPVDSQMVGGSACDSLRAKDRYCTGPPVLDAEWRGGFMALANVAKQR